jgi:hypothetical protein
MTAAIDRSKGLDSKPCVMQQNTKGEVKVGLLGFLKTKTNPTERPRFCRTHDSWFVIINVDSWDSLWSQGRGTRQFHLQNCRCQICWKNLVPIICMYDQCGQWRFSLVAWRGTHQFRLENCRCQIRWKSLSTLIVHADNYYELRFSFVAWRGTHQLHLQNCRCQICWKNLVPIIWMDHGWTINVDSWDSLWSRGEELVNFMHLQSCRCQIICWKDLVPIICMYDQCGQLRFSLVAWRGSRQFHASSILQMMPDMLE